MVTMVVRVGPGTRLGGAVMHPHGFGMAFVFLFFLATFDPVEDSAWYSAAKPTGRKALLGQALHRPLGMECIWHFACDTLMVLLDLAESGDQIAR